MQRNRESDERYDPNDSRITGNSDTRDEATKLKDAKKTIANFCEGVEDKLFALAWKKGYNVPPYSDIIPTLEEDYIKLKRTMWLKDRQGMLRQSSHFISVITGVRSGEDMGDSKFKEELEALEENASALDSKLRNEPRLFQWGVREEGDTDPRWTSGATIVARSARYGYDPTLRDGPDPTSEGIGEVDGDDMNSSVGI
nr:hypothetical protein L203_06681 [Cryptococcus depauperatus CBS 7841]